MNPAMTLTTMERVAGAPARSDEHRPRWKRVSTPVPRPEPSELLVAVRACGVCRTDLHVTEGDLPVHREKVTPGHEVVGEVVEGRRRSRVTNSASATGSGIAWFAAHLRGYASTVGAAMRTCVRPPATQVGTPTAATPNSPRYLQLFAHHLPSGYRDTELAPLLCAGIIGYRSLLRAGASARRPVGAVRVRRQRAHHRAGRAGPRAPRCT